MPRIGCPQIGNGPLVARASVVIVTARVIQILGPLLPALVANPRSGTREIAVEVIVEAGGSRSRGRAGADPVFLTVATGPPSTAAALRPSRQHERCLHVGHRGDLLRHIGAKPEKGSVFGLRQRQLSRRQGQRIARQSPHHVDFAGGGSEVGNGDGGNRWRVVVDHPVLIDPLQVATGVDVNQRVRIQNVVREQRNKLATIRHVDDVHPQVHPDPIRLAIAVQVDIQVGVLLENRIGRIIREDTHIVDIIVAVGVDLKRERPDLASSISALGSRRRRRQEPGGGIGVLVQGVRSHHQPLCRCTGIQILKSTSRRVQRRIRTHIRKQIRTMERWHADANAADRHVVGQKQVVDVGVGVLDIGLKRTEGIRQDRLTKGVEPRIHLSGTAEVDAERRKCRPGNHRRVQHGIRSSISVKIKTHIIGPRRKDPITVGIFRASPKDRRDPVSVVRQDIRGVQAIRRGLHATEGVGQQRMDRARSSVDQSRRRGGRVRVSGGQHAHDPRRIRPHDQLLVRLVEVPIGVQRVEQIVGVVLRGQLLFLDELEEEHAEKDHQAEQGQHDDNHRPAPPGADGRLLLRKRTSFFGEKGDTVRAATRVRLWSVVSHEIPLSERDSGTTRAVD